jgi:hypothetical protein
MENMYATCQPNTSARTVDLLELSMINAVLRGSAESTDPEIRPDDAYFDDTTSVRHVIFHPEILRQRVGNHPLECVKQCVDLWHFGAGAKLIGFKGRDVKLPRMFQCLMAPAHQ